MGVNIVRRLLIVSITLELHKEAGLKFVFVIGKRGHCFEHGFRLFLRQQIAQFVLGHGQKSQGKNF